jgi:anti-sigma-K factor RskA
MTSAEILALLNDYVDGTLSEPESRRVRELLDTDPDIRREYELTLALKEALRQQRHPDPGPAYWQEVRTLIQARTIDNEPVSGDAGPRSSVDPRRYFIRSLVSVAASIFILLSALLIGSNREIQPTTVVVLDRPVLISSSLAALLSEENTEVISPAEQHRLARGIFLLGPPGVLGRTAQLPDFIALR